MAVIQTIRNRFAKLAGFTIAIALIGFILMDAASGRFGDMLGKNTSAAKVNGTSIDAKDFALRAQQYENLYEVFSKGKPVDDAMRAQLHEQALKELIFEAISEKEADELGITVTKEEEKEAIRGANADPMIRQYPAFTNPETGMFDPARIAQYEKQLPQYDKTGKETDTWEAVKAYVVRSRKIQKINSLIIGSVYTPKFMMEQSIADQNKLANLKFVKIPYSSVNDDQVKVSESDLNDYVQKHANQFKSKEEARSVEYVSFDVNPSSEDTQKVVSTINDLKTKLIASTDVESFINRNSDYQYNDRYLSKKTFTSKYADTILALGSGTVYGPYMEGNSYFVVKVMDKKSLPDSVSAKHILIQPNQTRDDSASKKMADSIKLAIAFGANFDSLAIKFSDDQGSKVKGGDLGYFTNGMMVKEFNDAAFNGKVGDLEVVKTQFGYHVIKITDQKAYANNVKLAVLAKALEASTQTDQLLYAKANEFAGKYTTEKGFDEGVKAMQLNKRSIPSLKSSAFQVEGINNARELMRWVFEAKKGDVSSVFSLDNRYVIAKLVSIQEAGVTNPTGEVKASVETIIRNEKKAALLLEKYKNASSLEAVANASKQAVLNADSVNFANPFSANLGFEPKVIGYAFSDQLKLNSVSKPIKGADGLVYMMVTNRLSANKVPNPIEIMQQRVTTDMQTKNYISGKLEDIFLQGGTIKYNVNVLY